MYSISVWREGRVEFVSSAEIVAMLDTGNPAHARHASAIAEIEAAGIRYSGQDGDVLSAAMADALRARRAER